MEVGDPVQQLGWRSAVEFEARSDNYIIQLLWLSSRIGRQHNTSDGPQWTGESRAAKREKVEVTWIQREGCARASSGETRASVCPRGVHMSQKMKKPKTGEEIRHGCNQITRPADQLETRGDRTCGKTCAAHQGISSILQDFCSGAQFPSILGLTNYAQDREEAVKILLLKEHVTCLESQRNVHSCQRSCKESFTLENLEPLKLFEEKLC